MGFSPICVVSANTTSISEAEPQFYCPTTSGYGQETGKFSPTKTGKLSPTVTFKILINIDKDNALSKQCARALKNIKLCAIAVSILYTGILPLVFFIAQKDDAPGLIVFGTIPIFVSLVIAIFAAIFQALFGNIMDMSLDNELIVLDGQTIKR